MKTNIYVYPDYMSSGLWLGEREDEVMREHEEFLHVVPEALLLALKYWHEAWEYRIEHLAYCIDNSVGLGMSSNYRFGWWMDGQTLVDAMNDVQDEYEFIYKVEEYK